MNSLKKSIVVKRANSGLGLFANKDFKRGKFIIEYIGDHISHNEADIRGGKYLFTINKEVVIDGKNRVNIARYINHGCDPNAEAESDDDEVKIRIYAKKNIYTGDEITLDYGKEYWEDHIGKKDCKCNSCLSKQKSD